MLRGGELLWEVAARANGVRIGRPTAQAVGVVAVPAGDASVVHAALEKRSVFVNLVLLLPVGEVEPLLEERWAVGVQERPTVNVVVRHRGSPGMTTSASLDLGVGGPRSTPPCDTGLHVELPVGRLRVDEARSQALVPV